MKGRLLPLIVVLAAALTGSARAAVDDPPPGLIATSTTLAKVRALYVKNHDRERSRAATIIEEWRLTQDNMSGTYHVFRLGKDERDVTLLGPLFFEAGVHNGTHWQQTRNGITYTYGGVHEARDARSERAWLTDTDPRDVRLIGESVPLNAYVVEIDPAGGRHEWRFLDKRIGEHRAARIHREGPPLHDDVRRLPHLRRHPRTLARAHDRFARQRARSRAALAHARPHARSADVDIPANRRTLVEFPPGVTIVHLPMRVVNGLGVVKVHIGLKDYDFLLDCGAAGIVIDPSIVDDAHLETYGSRVGATLGTFTETTGVVPLMSIGGLHLRSVVARVVSVPFHLDERTHIAGLLGFDFFLDTIVHVDLDHGIANVIAPAAFKPPADAALVPLALDDRTPVVRARADAVSGRVVLDTGANRSVFTPPFASRADVAFDPGTPVAQFRGLGGMGTGETVRLKSFDIAALPLLDPVVDVSNANLGAEDVDGTAGTDLLHAYDLFFDYRTAALYVRRSKKA